MKIERASRAELACAWLDRAIGQRTRPSEEGGRPLANEIEEGNLLDFKKTVEEIVGASADRASAGGLRVFTTLILKKPRKDPRRRIEASAPARHLQERRAKDRDYLRGALVALAGHRRRPRDGRGRDFGVSRFTAPCRRSAQSGSAFSRSSRPPRGGHYPATVLTNMNSPIRTPGKGPRDGPRAEFDDDAVRLRSRKTAPRAHARHRSDSSAV